MTRRITPNYFAHSSLIVKAYNRNGYFSIIYSRNTKPIITKTLIKKIPMESLWTFLQNSNIFPEGFRLSAPEIELARKKIRIQE